MIVLSISDIDVEQIVSVWTQLRDNNLVVYPGQAGHTELAPLSAPAE